MHDSIFKNTFVIFHRYFFDRYFHFHRYFHKYFWYLINKLETRLLHSFCRTFQTKTEPPKVNQPNNVSNAFDLRVLFYICLMSIIFSLYIFFFFFFSYLRRLCRYIFCSALQLNYDCKCNLKNVIFNFIFIFTDVLSISVFLSKGNSNYMKGTTFKKISTSFKT